MITSARRIVVALALVAAPAAAQTTFTFDNVGPTYSYVGSTYSPFVFGGTAQVVQDGGAYGTLNCATSGAYCLYNGNAAQDVTLSRSDAGTFTLGSGYFTSWFGSTTATVVGSLAGAQVFSQTFNLGSTAALQSFGNATVDQVQFLASNGAGPGYFLADDITVNAGPSVPPTSSVPEPATVGLFATGLVGLAGFVRRRRRT